MHINLTPRAWIRSIVVLGIVGSVLCFYIVSTQQVDPVWYGVAIGYTVICVIAICLGVRRWRIVAHQYPDQAAYVAAHHKLRGALSKMVTQPGDSTHLTDVVSGNELRVTSPRRDAYVVAHTSHDVGHDETTGANKTVVTDVFYHVDNAVRGVRTVTYVYFLGEPHPTHKDLSKSDLRKQAKAPKGATYATTEELATLKTWLSTWK